MKQILALAFALLLLPDLGFAQVAISQLPAATTLSGSEAVPVVQSSTTKRATALQIGQSVGTAGLPMNAGTVINWNGDVGLSRDAAGDLAIGNGTQGDLTGSIGLSKVCFQGNANFTQISSGNLELGSGCAAGQNGNLYLNAIKINSITWGNAYPLTMNTPYSTAMYWTVPATNAPTNPYYDNLAIGDYALNGATHNSPAHCTSVSYPFANFCGDEVAFGDYALATDSQGHDNTALGDHSLANLTTGVQNTSVGSSALPNYNGSNSNAFGTSACQNVTNSVNPLTCIGLSALQNAGTSSGNVIAVGTQTMITTTTATSDVAVGDGAGYNSTSTTSSVLLGTNACSNGTTISNSICIGVGGPASGTYSNMLWIGGGTNPPIQGNLSTNALTFPGAVSVGGVLTAPTAAAGTNTTQVATTAFVNSRGIQSSGQQVISTSTTLGSSQAGANVLVSGSGITLTFPSAATTYALNNIGSSNVTLSYPGGADYFTALLPGNTVVLAGDGAGYWRTVNTGVTTGGAQRLAPLTFSALPTCNGSSNGALAHITDASAAITAWHQQVTAGGGSNSAFIACNGSGWYAFDY